MASILFSFILVCLLPFSEELGKSCTLERMVEDVATTVVSEAASILLSDETSISGSSLTGLKTCRPRDCADIYHLGHTKNGVYKIWPEGWRACGTNVYCDLENHGGAWTVIQRRGDFGKPMDYFFKRWRDYKFGFGNISEDFWLGNDKIHLISNQDNYQLRIDLTAYDGDIGHAVYEEFFIQSETFNYTLSVYGYSGNASDSLTQHNANAFSTKDRDNDSDGGNCAEGVKGAWWYHKCLHSNLNGLYHNRNTSSYGIQWNTWKGAKVFYREAVMKIRPKTFLISNY